MEAEATHGLAKLTRKSHPVTFNPFKYVLEDAVRELAALGQVGTVKKASLKRLASLFRKAPGGPIEAKVLALKGFIKDLEGKAIDAVLVPLTEAENLECQAHLLANLSSLRKAFDWVGIPEAQREGQEKAIDAVAEAAMVAKWIECSLKKKDKVNGEWVRYWERGGNKTLDPRVLKDLFIEYQTSFILTEDEKKN